MTPLQLAKSIAQFVADKKAEDIAILDMRKVANFCDYFVLCTGNSTRQVNAIANGVDQGVDELGLNIRYKQGMKEGRWVLLDLGHVVTHVFEKEAREFYGLDYLWQEAVKITPDLK